jgi:mannobiose 2-epimerase
MKKGSSLFLFVFCLGIAWNSAHAQTLDRKALATDIDTMLTNHYLKAYFPKIIDKSGGGVYMDFDRQFNSLNSIKNLNMESRHLFSASMGAIMHPEYAGFKQTADAIYAFIRDTWWDKSNGGSAIHAGQTSAQISPACDKPLYHNGFALTGLSAYYLATHDTMALHIAITTWKWIESRAHDSINGMYYGFLNSDGSLTNNEMKKDQDVLHHWIEGMAWLYIAWPANRPDSADRALLKKRVKESSDIFCGSKWVQSDGHIVKDNNRAMTAVSGVNDGLDAEDVYLFYFYYQAIDTVPPLSAVTNLKKVHAYVRTKSTPGKHFADQWWPDAELLSSYCSMGILYNAGDSYLQDCKTHWGFIKQSYFDPQYGGWYYNPNDVTDPKGTEWECTYHVVKCLLFCRNWLLGSQKGWVNPLATNARQGEKSQALKNEAQLNKTHYIMVMNNGRQLKQATGLYDLMGRSASVKNIQTRLSNGNVAGVYIVKP